MIGSINNKNMQIVDIRSLMAEVWQVGYMEAVKAYEPVRDQIRKSEVGDWLALMKIDRRVFRKLEKCGLIRAHKLGEGKNSPLVYSKAEIKKALATRSASRLYVADALAQGQEAGAGVSKI